MTNEQTFQIRNSMPADSQREGAAEGRKLEKLHDQLVRCLDFTVSRDNSVTVGNGVQVRVVARNRCDHSFAPSDAWIEVAAISISGSGVAGRQVGQFQTTIEPRGRAETILIVPCNPDRPYRFEASVWSAAGGERNAGE
jgi:hypothetical protein